MAERCVPSDLADGDTATPSKRISAAAGLEKRLVVRGSVRSEMGNYPLPGLWIEILYLEPAALAAQATQCQTLLGSAKSAADGSFLVTWMEAPRIASLLCLIANCREAKWVVRVRPDADGPSLLELPLAASAGVDMSLELSVSITPAKVTKTRWAELAARTGKAGIVQLNRLVNQLANQPAEASIFGDWTLAERHGVLRALEAAFLDPHEILSAIKPLPSWEALAAPGGVDAYLHNLGGLQRGSRVKTAIEDLTAKIEAFPSLSQVDWQIDPAKLKTDPGAAVTAHPGFDPRSRPGQTTYGRSNEVGYRDYLRTQWTSVVTLGIYAPPRIIDESGAKQQLRNRFHQDFTTTDTMAAAPNEILIPILIEILTAPPGGAFGFGIASASIPARGTANARDYLDTLIALSGETADEISLRYRTDFTRPDAGAVSSKVWENIHTLQGFFRDSFQSVPDPVHPDPDVLAEPIILEGMMGKAPFFLEYDEWVLLQQPVPYENYVQIRNVFHMALDTEGRTLLQTTAGVSFPSAIRAEAGFHLAALAVHDQLQVALALIDKFEFRAALDALNAIWNSVTPLSSPVFDTAAVVAAFNKRRGKSITSMDDMYRPVNSFAGDPGIMTMWQVGNLTYDGNPNDNDIENYFGFYTPKLSCALAYFYCFALPTLTGQTLLALGQYARAVRYLGQAASFLVGAGPDAGVGGWAPKGLASYVQKTFDLYVAGDLPYTVETGRLAYYPAFNEDDSTYGVSSSMTSALGITPSNLHPVERAYFKLQMGNAMLAWADTLYCANDASSIARARELYKGVTILHGKSPPIDPAWGSFGPFPFPYFPVYVNPAKQSQLARADLGFTQIEAGLNFFGYTNDMVPTQRYGTLIAGANAFAADAKSAEQDFLNAMAQIEQATIDDMKNTAMLKRAKLQVEIAGQQSAIAKDQVTQAKTLVAQVNDQIKKAQKDIDDHDSFFGQLGDFVKGIKDIATSGKDVGELASSGSSAADKLSLSEALGTGNTSLEISPAVAGGLSVLGIYGAAFAASYMTLSSMADAANQRQEQLQNLQNQNLASANAQLDIAQRQVTIADLQRQIAQADADLARDLLAFAQERYLSIEFWSYLAALFQRAMRRYLQFGARAGWLAQRALAYEQSVPIDIIGFDYYPAAHLGAGGADSLQLDLASLEAQHLAGLQELVPLKVTYSLARDFPLQLADLKRTGSCQFKTSDPALQAAYPGMYAFRIRAVTPRIVRITTGPAIRGVVANSGASQVSGADGTLSPSTRPADALPISEFDISTQDMNLFGLPGATLMQFEGSGFDTVWQITVPPHANPGGPDAISDVQITFSITARFSASLYQAAIGRAPSPSTKLLLLSAARLRLAALDDIKTKSAVDFAFDLGALSLPAAETGRTLGNLFVILAGLDKKTAVAATLKVKKPAQSIDIVLQDGVALSNATPITDPLSTIPASPLNALAGIDLEQSFIVHIDKAKNPGVDFRSIADVLIGLDYTATI